MEINYLFSQIVIQDEIDIDTKKIQDYCLNMERNEESRVKSNRGGWQSDDLKKTEEEYLMFLNQVISKGDMIKHHLRFSFDLELSNCWININRKKDYNREHTHPGSLFSGVFYVKVPDKSGVIAFVNPVQHLQNMHYEYWHLKYGEHIPKNKIFSNQWAYEPKEKAIIIFPSWLEHLVEPNQSDEERISISFNFGVKK
jgi:uncharacterized protein (TIGR02466 family)